MPYGSGLAASATSAVSELRASPKTTHPVLKLDGLGKTYTSSDRRDVVAVGSVSCTIQQGEFVSILGPSGCGKSTLIMMIAGLTAPTQGRIEYLNVHDNGQPEFGIVFQTPVLFPWRKVQANVELPGEVAGMEQTDRGNRARQLLRLVDLEGFESKYPAELSGGMQQRVAIARALMLNPTMLLMDEPFGALDAMTREQMNLEVQRISLEQAATVIFVTHSITEAAFLSNRVLVMSERPSTVKEIVTIDVPRPRSLEQIASGMFGRHISHLRNLLNAAGGAE